MTVQLDLGGSASSITDANMQKAAALGTTRIHVVVSDMGTHAAELALIHKYKMEGVLDVEIPLWVNIGMNVNADISWALPQLRAQQAAGWKYWSEEGGGRQQIEIIRADGRKLINYGSEDGANMYYGQYNHAADAHAENQMEWYHQYGINPDNLNGTYIQTAKDYYAKCKVFGLTLMEYTTGDLYVPSTEPLRKSLDQLRAAGVPVSSGHMWWGQESSKAFEPTWMNVINFLKGYYGGFAPFGPVTPPTPPAPPTPPKNPARFTVGIYEVNQTLKQATFVGSTYTADGKELPRATLNVYRSSKRGTTENWKYIGSPVSNEGGAWRITAPLAGRSNFFYFVTKDERYNFWTTDVIWV